MDDFKVKDTLAYKFFKRRTKAEEFARDMNGTVYDSNSEADYLATQGEEDFKAFFPYVVEWENPSGYFIVEWLDRDMWTTDFYRDRANALEDAAERWKLMSDKAKSESFGFEVVKAITDDDASFWLENVTEVVKSFNRGNHIAYPKI